MPYPSRIIDSDELIAVFEDHRECVYLGEWKELKVGGLRLVRREDGSVEVKELEEEFIAL